MKVGETNMMPIFSLTCEINQNVIKTVQIQEIRKFSIPDCT